MRALKILNMRHVSTWAKYENAPAALVPIEHSRWPCDKCPGHCCHHTCHLSAFEAARIALTLNLELERFVEPERYEPAPEARGVRVFHGLDLDDGPVRLRFRQRGEGIAPCVFLVDHAGVGRCSIYALRPGVCRQYPYAVRDGDEEIAVGGTELCRPEWLYDEGNEEFVAGSLDQWRADLDADAELCARWNDSEQSERTFAALCRWLTRECAAEFGGDPERVYPTPRRGFRFKKR